MGLIYIFIGVSATLLLFGVGAFFVYMGIKLYNIIKSNILKVTILFLSCIPLIIAGSLYLGGLLASFAHWFGEDNNVTDLILTIQISFLTATGNILEPGLIMVSGSGKGISTINETIFSSFILLFLVIYLIKKYHNKLLERNK